MCVYVYVCACRFELTIVDCVRGYQLYRQTSAKRSEVTVSKCVCADNTVCKE